MERGRGKDREGEGGRVRRSGRKRKKEGEKGINRKIWIKRDIGREEESEEWGIESIWLKRGRKEGGEGRSVKKGNVWKV